MPAGQEGMARAFYSGVLGLFEELKPANLATRGGVWFRGGETGLHLGVDAEFRAAVAALDLPPWYAANVHLFARPA